MDGPPTGGGATRARDWRPAPTARPGARQAWRVATRERLYVLRGHAGFTTRECPFLLFTAQSAAPGSRGDYLCSGSEVSILQRACCL